MLLQALVVLTSLTLLLPLTLSMSLTNMKIKEDESTRENYVIPIIRKRHISGADPWSLCPHGMERVDCFYEYLRVYARLRKAAEISNSVSVRNIGKRSDYSATRYAGQVRRIYFGYVQFM